MQKPIAGFIVVALALSGCVMEPPGPGPRRMPPPPPPPQALHEAETAPRPLQGPPPVKSLGMGMLTAQAAGGYIDREEAELRAELKGRAIVVTRSGDNLVLNIPSDSLFGINSVVLNAKGMDVLQTVALDLRKFDSTQIVVNCYTDTTGTDDLNLKVSQKRADGVAGALTRDGVDSHRVAAKGFGAEILKVPTGPGKNEPRNRRIEIRITPKVKT
ncbi:MAG TPA: OmpA family protein [Rhizomicrobium sp.]|jgi:outer membrane protein OmpA-like peptidoglycan-associated protein